MHGSVASEATVLGHGCVRKQAMSCHGRCSVMELPASIDVFFLLALSSSLFEWTCGYVDSSSSVSGGLPGFNEKKNSRGTPRSREHTPLYVWGPCEVR